jgi:hypothetical protein
VGVAILARAGTHTDSLRVAKRGVFTELRLAGAHRLFGLSLNLARDESVFERKLNKPLAVTDSELAVDMSTVCLHGANGDEELSTDLGIAQPERKAFADFELPIRQSTRPFRRLLDRQPCTQFGIQKALTVCGGADGGDQLGIGGIFEHISQDAAAKSAAGVDGLVLHRQHNDLSVWELGAHFR